MSLTPTPTTYTFQPAEVFTGEPRDHEYDSRAITVAWRGGSNWCIQLGDGWSPNRVWDFVTVTWEYEPRPSERDDEFYARTRRDLDYCLSVAEVLANDPTRGDR